MRIRLLAIGQKMPAWVNEGYQNYSKRITDDASLELLELPMAKRAKNANEEKLKQQEGDALLTALNKQEMLVALDVKGKSHSTESLAQLLKDWQMQGSDIAFAIGGPDGLSEAVLAKADRKISLSALTLPHPLVRVLLAEQLYRAWSINKGHPYHR